MSPLHAETLQERHDMYQKKGHHTHIKEIVAFLFHK